MKKKQTMKRGTNEKDTPYFNPYERPKVMTQKTTKKATSTKTKKTIPKAQKGKNYSTIDEMEYATSPELRRKAIQKRNKLSKAQVERNRKRKRRRFISRLFFMVICVAFGVWGILKLTEAFSKTEVSTQLVKLGTLDLSDDYEGIILRNEKVYTSEVTGNIQYNIGEGEKIKKEGIIYAIVGDEEALVKTEEDKSTIDNEIYNAADKRKDISYYQDEVSAINNDFATKMQEYYDDINNSDISSIYTLRNQLDENVDDLTALYTKEQEGIDASISEKNNVITNNLAKYKSVHKASESGIVSYKIDGEEDLNINSINELDYSTYNKIFKKSTTKSLIKTHIEQGQEVYKIVLDNTWYIVTYVSKDKDEAFKEGQTYDLNFEVLNEESIGFTLVSKVEENKKLKLVFKTQEQMDTFLTTRQVHFSIGNKNESGLKIPVQSIVEQRVLKIPTEYKVEKDNKVGVQRKNGELVEFVEISPQSEAQDMMYILQDVGNLKGLTVGTQLLHPVSGKVYTIEDFETLQGVYVINGSITQFKKIEIYVQNDQYAIIKNNSSTQLKEKDKIISNPKNIKMDQLLEDMTIKNE